VWNPNRQMWYEVLPGITEMKSNKTRTVRFSDQDIERIERFLLQNPFLDFSSLSRLAIMHFIERPRLDVKPLRAPSRKKIKGATA
jgi:hypothetical protein